MTVKRKTVKLPTVPEADEQAALFNLIENVGVKYYPELRLLYHIPNGGKRNAAEAAHLKQQGVKAGVSLLAGAARKVPRPVHRNEGREQQTDRKANTVAE